MFSSIRPIASVVLNCWVTDTKVTPCLSKIFTNSAKSNRERLRRSIL